VERGLGFGAGRRDRTAAGAAMFMEESQPEVDDDMWGQGVREREKGRRIALGDFLGGPWADSWPGPDSVPRPLTLFFCLKPFPISVFLFLSKLLQNSFKTNQTNF
jgi:hypothetical protein